MISGGEMPSFSCSAEALCGCFSKRCVFEVKVAKNPGHLKQVNTDFFRIAFSFTDLLLSIFAVPLQKNYYRHG